MAKNNWIKNISCNYLTNWKHLLFGGFICWKLMKNLYKKLEFFERLLSFFKAKGNKKHIFIFFFGKKIIIIIYYYIINKFMFD